MTFKAYQRAETQSYCFTATHINTNRNENTMASFGGFTFVKKADPEVEKDNEGDEDDKDDNEPVTVSSRRIFPFYHTVI